LSNAALELFNERLPHKPYFSDDLHFGVRIAGKERAILAKYIQFNQPHAMFWLGFDVDRAGAAIDWSDRNAPAPTLTINTRKIKNYWYKQKKQRQDIHLNFHFYSASYTT
jgi:hypothetical protein